MPPGGADVPPRGASAIGGLTASDRLSTRATRVPAWSITHNASPLAEMSPSGMPGENVRVAPDSWSMRVIVLSPESSDHTAPAPTATDVGCEPTAEELARVPSAASRATAFGGTAVLPSEPERVKSTTPAATATMAAAALANRTPVRRRARCCLCFGLPHLSRAGRRSERRVLVEDVALELLERRARLDPEFLRERAPGVGVGVERIRLAAAAVERDHLLPAQAFAQGLAADHGLELGGDLAVAPEREVRLDAILERRQPELLERSRRALCERLAREIGQRRAAPERERLAQVARRGLRAPGDELLARMPDGRFEAVEVELTRPDVEDVSRAAA